MSQSFDLYKEVTECDRRQGDAQASGWKVFSYNHAKIICKFYHTLVQFPFITSERELDHYHEKLNIRVASLVVERLKT